MKLATRAMIGTSMMSTNFVVSRIGATTPWVGSNRARSAGLNRKAHGTEFGPCNSRVHLGRGRKSSMGISGSQGIDRTAPLGMERRFGKVEGLPSEYAVRSRIQPRRGGALGA